jgi:methyl-accepting chemotaxis protein
MSLKAKVILTASAVVMVLFGISEWISYHQIAAHLAQWEVLLERQEGQASALAYLREERTYLLEKLAALWFLTAGVTCLLLLLALNFLWRRMVQAPLRDLMRHIDWMSRGTWNRPVEVNHNDEVGNLAEAFNQLGDRLTFTVHQFAIASKLSALAVVGQRIVRKVSLIREHVLAIRNMLATAQQNQEPIPQAAVENLTAAAGNLESLESDFESEFERELRQHTSPDKPEGENGNGGSRRWRVPGLPSGKIFRQ